MSARTEIAAFEPHARWERIIVTIGYAAALFGAIVIVGWYAHLAALVQLKPGLAPAQYNTALCFIAAGFALAARKWRRRLALVPILGGAIALMGALTLGEYVFHAGFGIDQLFFRSYWPEPSSHAGRMSAISALCLFLIGITLLLDKKEPGMRRSLIVGTLASIVIAVSVIALLGYAFNLPDAYRWGQLTRIAPHSACGLGALGAAIFLGAWQNGRREDERTPRWLPIPLAFGILTVSLVLYFALASRQDEAITETINTGMETAKSQISIRIDARIRSLVRIAGRWEFSGRPTEAVWTHDAFEYVRDFPDIQAIEWIDASRRIQWIVPLAGNEAKLNLDLTQEANRRSAIEFARDHKRSAITRITPLFRGDIGFIIYVPIYVKGEFDGWIAGIMKTQPLLDRYFPPGVLLGEAIRVSEGDTVFYERDTASPPANKNWRAKSSIDVHGVIWNVQVWPTPQLTKRLDSPLPDVILAGGIVGSLLLAVTAFLAQRSSTHARVTARALRELKEATAEIKTLTGMLPICASCKRVRDDTGYWNQIESYLSHHSEASFSHGYCPQCAVNACREFGIAIPAKIQAELDANNFEA